MYDQERKNRPQPPQIVHLKKQTSQFDDKRASTSTQLKVQSMISSSDNEVAQQKVNKTGLPNKLKDGVENLSGYSMDDVKVHYNSSKPAQLSAHAFAQGNRIHLGPGQEKHLPHEAWHVVQQKQGRVAPTKQLKGKVSINDDIGLEKEADLMGTKALSFRSVTNKTSQKRSIETIPSAPIQCYSVTDTHLISDGKQLAVPKDGRPHHYLSSNVLFQASQAKLVELKSPVTLIRGAQNEALGGLYQITAGGVHNENADPHHPLQKHECIDVAAEILKAPDSGRWIARVRDMGIGLSPHQIESIQKLIHPIVTSTGSRIRDNHEFTQYIGQANQELENSTSIPGTGATFIENLKALDITDYPSALKTEIRERFRYDEMPVHKMILFFKYLKEEGATGKFKAANEDNADEYVTALWTRVQKVYGGAFAYDSRDKRVTSGYQINEHAVAELGEALAILSTSPRDFGSHKWNFHFAAVIAKDGPDIVSMENETNSAEDRAANWAFKMYGTKKGQSFHEQHAHGAEKPLTVPVSPKPAS